ncbi:YnhF family membrane protein [Photobacterium japonica]
MPQCGEGGNMEFDLKLALVVTVAAMAVILSFGLISITM